VKGVGVKKHDEGKEARERSQPCRRGLGNSCMLKTRVLLQRESSRAPLGRKKGEPAWKVCRGYRKNQIRTKIKPQASSSSTNKTSQHQKWKRDGTEEVCGDSWGGQEIG